MPLISGDGPDQDQPAKIGESKRQVGAKLSWPTSPSARSRLGSERKRTGNDVAEPSLEDWERQDQTVIAQYYEQTALDFFRIINEYFTQANAVTILYKQCVESHARWRFWMIIAMGILAV